MAVKILKSWLFILALSLMAGRICPALAGNQHAELVPETFKGLAKSDFEKFYPKTRARTYREVKDETWITFDVPHNAVFPENTVTFHLKSERVADWRINDRPEIIEEYLGEFESRAFPGAFPKIDAAIRDVLSRIPYADFLKITDRRRPVLFTEVFDSGTAQFANSSEISSLPDDPPAFQDGFTLIKLSTGLNAAADPKAIEGVIAHEIAHRVLDHVKHGKRSCEAEREANNLIKQWGFGAEYEQASQTFGHKAVGQTYSCEDKANP